MKEVQKHKEYDLTLPEKSSEGNHVFLKELDAKTSRFQFSALLDYVDTSEATTDELLDNIEGAGSALAWCISTVLESQTAAELLFSLPLEKWTVSLASDDIGYHFDTDTSHLTLGLDQGTAEMLSNSPLLRHTLFFDFLYALRDIWFEIYASKKAQSLRPDEYLKWERFRQSDITSLSILTSWEILAHGDDRLWKYISAFENGDMALAFVRKLTNPSMSDEDSLAQARWQAFKYWYRDHERVTFCDKDSLSYMDERMESEENGFGDMRFNADFIKEISQIAGFQNYFEGHEADLTRSPEFSILPDEICQTHLLHIMTDLESFETNGVRFRSKNLALKIFPDQI